MNPRRKTKSGVRGYSIAELPAALILLIVGIMLPMIILASISYRASFLWFATRDACIRAAKAPTYTQGAANANTRFAADIGAFSEISGTLTLRVLRKRVDNNSAPTVLTGPINSNQLNTNNSIYFIRTVCNGTVAPLVKQAGNYFGLIIPGLTTDMDVRFFYEAYVENPNGLTQ